MGLIIIIPADASQPVQSREADEQPPVHELNAIVGGSLEHVPLWNDYMGMDCAVYCNEEGKLHNMPVNVRATVLWYQHNGRRLDDVLVGDVVMVVGLPDKPEE